MMSVTTNGTRTRKTLATQLDRLDGILDGLSDGLSAAVADAVREALDQSIRKTVQQEVTTALTHRALLSKAREELLEAQPPRQLSENAPVASAPSNGRRKVQAAWKDVRRGATCLWQEGVNLCKSARDGLGWIWMHRRDVTLPLLVGLCISFFSYWAGPAVASALAGLAALALAAIAVMLRDVWSWTGMLESSALLAAGAKPALADLPAHHAPVEQAEST